jgi:hypothetical protein
MDMVRPQQAQGQSRRPSKEQVREWMMSRLDKREPPPAPDQLRRLLGWSGHAPPIEA